MNLIVRQLIAWTAIALCVAVSISAGGAEIVFKPQAAIRGSLVLLGDLAEVRGLDEHEVKRLERIELFPVPARGRQRLFREVELRQLLQLHGVAAPAHTFSGAETIRVGAETKTSVVTRLQEEAKQAVQTDAVIAKRAIAPGEILRAVDVETKVFETLPAGLSVATDLDLVVGREAMRALAPGDPIDTRALRKPILVRRGEAVVVVAKAAGVRVRTTAKAMSDGAQGDIIRLEAEGNRQTFTAVVTGLREAEVFASGTTVSSQPSTAFRESNPRQGTR